MKKSIVILLMIAALFGCSSKQQQMPAETPEAVVDKFFKLVSEGGPTSLAEARKMVSDKYVSPTEENFKKWVESYAPGTEVKNLKSQIIKNDKNEVIARVEFEYSVESEFGGNYEAKSIMNLILDNKSNQWKVDFTAETLPEELDKKEAGG